MGDNKPPRGRPVYFVPADAHVKGDGYRISVVFEGENGHYPTGTWPYEGKPGQKQPYFARTDDYDEAKRIVDAMNAERGIDPLEAATIVARSMAKRWGRRGRRR